eukprot:Skav235460  [mRNA]  locus=scaffold1451:27264:29552:+ [translate_table: standard]
MRWLQAWAQLLRDGFEQSVIASCQFGSPHRKEFMFLTYGLKTSSLQVKCPGGHPHIKIEGAYTKSSAVYTWDLAKHLAQHFARALRAFAWAEDLDNKHAGYESVVVNDLLVSRQWHTQRCWSWKSKSHINILEGHSALQVVKKVAWDDRRIRFIGCLDSRVAKGALAKGRSSAVGLQKICKKQASLCVAAEVYPGWTFAPTRLNPSDDPTRDCAVRLASGHSILDLVDQRALQSLHHLQLSRPYANWIRLILLLGSFCPSLAVSGLGESCGRWTLDLWPGTPSCSESGSYPSSLDFGIWIFEEGGPCCAWLLFGHWISGLAWTVVIWVASSLLCAVCFGALDLNSSPRFSRWFRFCVLVAVAPYLGSGKVPVAEAMFAATPADAKRAADRAGILLKPSRVVRQSTLDFRRKLLEDFKIWLQGSHGIALEKLLTDKPPDGEEVSRLLVEYGQELFASGKAYNKYVETINGIVAARPCFKKALAGAWDLAFAWLQDQPFSHHPAMPLSVLLAMVTLALLWGWPTEAAVLALTWTGICRIGEVLLAERADLVLPCDAAPGVTFAMLRIRSPKTRGRAARHQAARVDPPDVVALLTATYARSPASSKLWPWSPATLRKRFRCLLEGLKLPTEKSCAGKPFDLGSLRPGGATYLLLSTEDSELVRRRGRWVTTKVCEVYLQEVLYSTYTEKLPTLAKQRIQALAMSFPQVQKAAISFLNAGIPPTVWNSTFQARDHKEHGADGGDRWYGAASATIFGQAADGKPSKQ